jgi:hypothetical protein
MQFRSILGLVVLFVSAVGAENCTRKSTCAAQKVTPYPANVHCGDKGYLTAINGAVIKDTTTPGSTAAQCALRCIQDPNCKNFAFGTIAKRCRTFRNSLVGMGLKSDPKSPVQFWHRSCWKKTCPSTCTCSAPKAICGTACVDKNTDPNNCGACGKKVRLAPGYQDSYAH